MAVVVSAGELSTSNAATIAGSWTPLEPFATRLADDRVMTYAAIYAAQSQVRTVISFLARNVADLSLQVFRRVSDTDRQRVTDHPFARTLGAPLPGVTPYRFKEALVSDLCIFDTYYAAKMRGQDGRVGLLRIPPEWVTPMGGTWWAPAWYRVAGGGTQHIDIAADRVLAIHGYNPSNARAGLPPMESLRQILAEDFEATRYRQGLWRSGAKISGVISRPVEASDWSDTARSRFMNDWRAQYVSGGSLGGTPLLEEGMTFAPHSFSAEQAQYIESRKLSREEAAAAFHVPPPMVGILDHATFSNITEQHKNLYQDTLGPILTMVQEEFAAQLLPEFDDVADLYVEFNLQAKLRGSFEEQATQLQTAVGGPWLTRNEARARQNLSAIEGGDELIVPLNVIEGGQASPTDAGRQNLSSRALPGRKRALLPGAKARAPRADQNAYESALSDYFTRQGEELLDALAEGVDVADVWDDERWHDELVTVLSGQNVATATAAARRTLSSLGLDPDLFDAAIAQAWLDANASGVASGVNEATRGQLEDAQRADDADSALRDVFVVAAGARAAQIAVDQTTSISGFGTHEAIQQTGYSATKTWVTGGNPRSAHAALDGETVGLSETFSNGGRWPGDSLLDADERAGCNCSMTVDVDTTS